MTPRAQPSTVSCSASSIPSVVSIDNEDGDGEIGDGDHGGDGEGG